jgi:hypothetical protein
MRSKILHVNINAELSFPVWVARARVKSVCNWQIVSVNCECNVPRQATSYVDKARFWGIFWVDVSTTSLAQAGFSAIASQLSIAIQSWEDVRQSLANQKEPWLLVLDNADDPNVDYQQYFPTSTSGIVILTSRNPDCQQYATVKWINLEGLPDDEACELLLQAARVSRDHHRMLDNDASIVVDLLWSHPLALIQAGSYVYRGHCMLSEYPKVFNHHQKRILTFQPSQAQPRYQDVYTMFEASIMMLHSSNTESAKDALDLLPVLALCAPIRLPIVRLFEAVWKGIAKAAKNSSHDDLDSLTPWHVSQLLPLGQVGSTTWDSFRLIEAIHQLKVFSLVAADVAQGPLMVSMHPLVRAWARHRLNAEQEHKSWVVMGCLLAFSTTDAILWQEYGGERLHLPLQILVSWEMKTMFRTEPPLMICRILLFCGLQLARMGDNTSIAILVESLCTYLGLDPTTIDQELVEKLRVICTELPISPRFQRRNINSEASDHVSAAITMTGLPT